MRNKKLIILFSVICAITLLAVLSGVIFSVQKVSAYCYNAPGEESSADIAENHGIKKHTNIFMVSEDKIIQNIQEAVPKVRVINVERKFPNHIIINYVEIYEYLKIYADGKTYFCSNDGKILRITDGTDPNPNVVELLIKGKLESTQVGQKFASDVSSDIALVTALLSGLERLDYRQNVADLIKKIDLTHPVNIVLTASTGMTWNLIGSNYINEKLRLALSAYLALDDDQKKVGSFVLTDGNPVHCQYVPPKG